MPEEDDFVPIVTLGDIGSPLRQETEPSISKVNHS